MRHMFKVLAVIIVLALTLTMLSVSIFAAEPKLIKTFKPSSGHLNEGEGFGGSKDDANGKLIAPGDKITFLDSGLTITKSDYTFQEEELLKFAFVVNLKDVDESAAGRIIVHPGFMDDTDTLIDYNIGGQVWPSFYIADLAPYAGETVILVGYALVPEGTKTITLRTWKDVGFDCEFLEAMIATNGYNFDQYKGHSVVAELDDPLYGQGASEYLETADKPSWTGDQGSTAGPSQPSNSDPAKTIKPTDQPDNPGPKTADPSITFVLFTAAAAAFGGLKLRKK